MRDAGRAAALDREGNSGEVTRIAIAVKTTEGGRWIVPQILEARTRNVEVVVIIPHGTGRLVTLVEDICAGDIGVTLVRAPVHLARPGVRAIRDVLSVRRTVKAMRLDAVLYHLYASALMIRISTIGLRIRRVHMVAGPLYLESPLIRFCERFLVRLDSAIICGSRYTWEKYRSLGVSRDKLSTIPYGVDLDAFAPPTDTARHEAKAELGYESDAFVAVMVSYVYAPKRMVFAGKGIKGHEDLLDAWPAFARRHADVALLIVGSGFDDAGEAYRQELLDRVPAGEIEPTLHWLSSVDDVRAVYSAADISISPSLSENHGAALEASAMGVVCVVSDAGALPETIDSEAGWVHSAGSPTSLLSALEDAYQEWESSRLGLARGKARRFMEESFSQLDGARSVIDVVLSDVRGEGR